MKLSVKEYRLNHKHLLLFRFLDSRKDKAFSQPKKSSLSLFIKAQKFSSLHSSHPYKNLAYFIKRLLSPTNTVSHRQTI
jgi:hypothetical protein